MKIMQVEVLSRDSRDDGEVMAVAYPQNGLLSDAGIGGGSEREAILQAINSYYNRLEAREAADTFIDPRVPPVVSLPGRMAVSEPEIKRLLEDNIGRQVAITGTKVNGAPYYNRYVTPLAIQTHRYDDANYLYCDTDAGHRTFKLNGVERAEVVT